MKQPTYKITALNKDGETISSPTSTVFMRKTGVLVLGREPILTTNHPKFRQEPGINIVQAALVGMAISLGAAGALIVIAGLLHLVLL